MSRIFRTTMWVLIGLGLLVTLVIGGATVMLSPATGAISAVFSALYIAAVLWLLRLFRPAFPDAGTGWIVASLLWGAAASLIFVFPSAMSVMALSEYTGWYDAVASWGGAYPEEAAKALGIIFVLFSYQQLNRPWHAVIVGAVIGLGFETFENILYGVTGGMMDLESDMRGMLITWAQRVFVGPFLHITFTAIAGWGIGWAIYAARRGILWRLTTGLSWLALAFTLHFAWNYMTDTDVTFVIKNIIVCAVMYPVFGWILTRSKNLAAADHSYSYQKSLSATPR